MRKAAGIGLSVVGLVVLIIGILLGTVWRPSTEISGETRPSGDGYVITAPGVMNLSGKTVHIRVTADGEEVRLATGYADDVAAYTSGYAHQTIQGVSAVDKLKVSSEAGKAPTGNANASDMWLVTKTDTGQLDVDYNVTLPGEEALIASTKSGAMPTVTLTWQRSTGPSLALPVSVVGIVVLLVGLLLLLLDAQAAADSARTISAARARHRARVDGADAQTTVMPTVGQNTEAAPKDEPAEETEERAHSVEENSDRAKPADEAADGADSTVSRNRAAAMTAGGLGAEILPASSRSDDFRQRPLDPAARLVINEQEAASGQAPEPNAADTTPADTDGPAERAAIDAPIKKSTHSSTWWKLWGKKGGENA